MKETRLREQIFYADYNDPAYGSWVARQWARICWHISDFFWGQYSNWYCKNGKLIITSKSARTKKGDK